MAEILFYHLTTKPLKTVLPQLVAKGLERNARMVIETSSPENVQKLSELLWSSEDVAFLPHGHGDDAAEEQPVWLCATPENPNQSSWRFFLGGAMPQSLDGLDRAVILFEEEDQEALASARNEWKKRKAEGHAISYWRPDENGRWVNLAGG